MPAASSPGRFRETGQRVHHYGQLIARWRRVARAAGLKLRPFAQAGERTLYCLESAEAAGEALYLSAGIHGDEPAGPEGLLRWAERRPERLRRIPLLIFPCLNPWGLVNNQRTDAAGVDLNRVFDGEQSPIGEWKALVAGRRFRSALCLHEDYDALGVYLYELSRRPADDVGRDLLKAAAKVLPVDTRKGIEGRRFREGLMLRRTRLREIPLHPESLYLCLHNTAHGLTFETPSEFSLARRVETMVRVLDAYVWGAGRGK